MAERYLTTYLQDHLAMLTGELELLKRVISENRGQVFAERLEALLPHTEDDADMLRNLLDRFGGRPSGTKEAAAWVGEKLGRLKMNDQLRGYSPLSRLEEHEGLLQAANARRAMWVALGTWLQGDPRADGIDLGPRAERATFHIEALKALHREAVAAMPAPHQPAP